MDIPLYDHLPSILITRIEDSGSNAKPDNDRLVNSLREKKHTEEEKALLKPRATQFLAKVTSEIRRGASSWKGYLYLARQNSTPDGKAHLQDKNWFQMFFARNRDQVTSSTIEDACNDAGWTPEELQPLKDYLDDRLARRKHIEAGRVYEFITKVNQSRANSSLKVIPCIVTKTGVEDVLPPAIAENTTENSNNSSQLQAPQGNATTDPSLKSNDAAKQVVTASPPVDSKLKNQGPKEVLPPVAQDDDYEIILHLKPKSLKMEESPYVRNFEVAAASIHQDGLVLPEFYLVKENHPRGIPSQTWKVPGADFNQWLKMRQEKPMDADPSWEAPDLELIGQMIFVQKQGKVVSDLGKMEEQQVTQFAVSLMQNLRHQAAQGRIFGDICPETLHFDKKSGHVLINTTRAITINNSDTQISSAASGSNAGATSGIESSEIEVLGEEEVKSKLEKRVTTASSDVKQDDTAGQLEITAHHKASHYRMYTHPLFRVTGRAGFEQDLYSVGITILVTDLKSRGDLARLKELEALLKRYRERATDTNERPITERKQYYKFRGDFIFAVKSLMRQDIESKKELSPGAQLGIQCLESALAPKMKLWPDLVNEKVPVLRPIATEIAAEVADGIRAKIPKDVAEAPMRFQLSFRSVAGDVADEIAEEVIKQATEKMTQKIAQAVTKEVAGRVVQQIAEQATKAVGSRATSKSIAEQATQAIAEQIAEGVTKDAAEDAAEQIAKKIIEDRKKPVVTPDIAQIAEGVTKDAAEDAAEQIAKKIIEDRKKPVVTPDIAQIVAKVDQEVVLPTPEKVIKRATAQAVNRFASEVANRVAKQVANRVAKQVAKQASEQVAEQIIKDIDDQIVKQASQEVAKQIDAEGIKMAMDQKSLQDSITSTLLMGKFEPLTEQTAPKYAEMLYKMEERNKPLVSKAMTQDDIMLSDIHAEIQRAQLLPEGNGMRKKAVNDLVIRRIELELRIAESHEVKSKMSQLSKAARCNELKIELLQTKIDNIDPASTMTLKEKGNALRDDNDPRINELDELESEGIQIAYQIINYETDLWAGREFDERKLASGADKAKEKKRFESSKLDNMCQLKRRKIACDIKSIELNRNLSPDDQIQQIERLKIEEVDSYLEQLEGGLQNPAYINAQTIYYECWKVKILVETTARMTDKTCQEQYKTSKQERLSFLQNKLAYLRSEIDKSIEDKDKKSNQLKLINQLFVEFPDFQQK